MGRVIYHIKGLLVVIWATLKNYINFLSVEKNRFEIVDFWSNFELLRQACRVTIAYLREIYVMLVFGAIFGASKATETLFFTIFFFVFLVIILQQKKTDFKLAFLIMTVDYA